MTTQSEKWKVLWSRLPTFLRSPNPDVFLGDNYITLDFETTNTDKGDSCNRDNSIVCAGWYRWRSRCSKPEFHYHRGDHFSLDALADEISEVDFVVAHNAKFEAGWLRRAGLDIRQILFYDTMLGEVVYSGNRSAPGSFKGPLRRIGLDASLERWGIPSHKSGLVPRLMAAGTCPSELPEAWLAEYNKLDVLNTDKLFRMQRKLLDAEGLLPTLFTRCLSVPVLTMMETVGMHLDAERVEVVGSQVKTDLEKAEYDLNFLTGGINFRSPKQKREFLYGTEWKAEASGASRPLGFKVPLKPNGQPLVSKKTQEPKTDDAALSLLVPKTPRQKGFIEALKRANKAGSAWSKALEKYTRCVQETDDALLYCTFNQARVATHRLSATGKKYAAQFQNIAKSCKPLFSPRAEGWLIGEADYAQLEYRVAVYLGDDEAGRADIKGGVDSHSYTASIIFASKGWGEDGRSLSDAIRKSLRDKSKAHTFKPLFGGESGTADERDYYAAFRQKHRGISTTQQGWIDSVVSERKLKTATGLVFYWPDTKIQRSGYVTNSANICNYPIQSLATAEIVPVGVVYLDYLMQAAGMKSLLINTVHDSAIGEIAPGEEETWKYLANQGMVKCVLRYLKRVYSIDFDVPLEVEVEFGDHWADSPAWREQWLGN